MQDYGMTRDSIPCQEIEFFCFHMMFMEDILIEVKSTKLFNLLEMEYARMRRHATDLYRYLELKRNIQMQI